LPSLCISQQVALYDEMTYGASSAVQCWQEDALDMTLACPGCGMNTQ